LAFIEATIVFKSTPTIFATPTIGTANAKRGAIILVLKSVTKLAKTDLQAV
jgi:hypothetical protein